MISAQIPVITVFTSTAEPLTKRFTCLPDGTIQKEVLAAFYAGNAKTCLAESATALHRILTELGPLQAISTGRCKTSDKVSIGKRGKLRAWQVSRSKSAFEFPRGPGWLVWDYDTKSMPLDVAQRVADLGGPLEALFHVWPEARNGAYVIRPSSSDGVTAPGQEPSRSTGVHGYFLIDDVSQSKAALNNLQTRAWTMGLAWIALSKSGAQLVRSIFDTAVGSPERLVFEAAPIIMPPLMRRPRADMVHDADVTLAVPFVSDFVFARAQKAEAVARQAIAPKAKKVEADFVNERARALAKKTGKSLSAATSCIRQVLRGATLADDYLLQLSNGIWMSVGELLDDPDRYDRLSLPDPIEGLDYGTDNATLLIKPRSDHPEDRPVLVSHAHGQKTIYTFARYDKPTEPAIPSVWPRPVQKRAAALKSTTDIIERWGDLTDASIRARHDVANGHVEAGEVTVTTIPTVHSTVIDMKSKKAFASTDQMRSTASHAVSPLVWLVSGAQGTGKTATVVGSVRNNVRTPGLMHKGLGYVSVMYSIDHAKSTEAYEDYVSARPVLQTSPRPLQIRGMGAMRPDGAGTMCEFAEVMTKAAAQGVDVKGGLCPICPRYRTCPITLLDRDIEDAKLAPEGAALFAVHDHAFATLPKRVVPSRAIFDERPRDFGHRKYAVPVDMWNLEFGGYLQWNTRHADQTADQICILETLIDPLRAAIFNAVVYKPSNALPIIAAAATDLAQPGETAAEVVGRAAKELRAFETHRLGENLKSEMGRSEAKQSPDAGLDRLKNRLNSVVTAAEKQHVRAMIGIFQAVAAELAQDHGPKLRSVLRVTTKSSDCIVAETVARTTLPEGIPVLHLDGTADYNLAQAWFGPDLEQFHYPVERLTIEAIFVEGHSFSTTSLTGRHYLTGEPWNAGRAAETRDRWSGIFSQFPGSFIAMPKAAIEAFGDLPGHKVGYFGAVRGRNLAADCQTGIVIGRNLPKPRDLERLARAFAVALDRPFLALPNSDEAKDIRFPTRVEGIRMRIGNAHGIVVAYHPDPTAQALLRQIRDAEASQAIDRVRAHFTPKRFIIAGACIPDMTFDRVVEWQEFHQGGSKVSRTVSQSHVLPLSPAELLLMFPKIWGSESTITRDEQYQEIRAFSDADLLRGQPVYRYTIYKMTPQKIAACLVSYTRPLVKTGRGIRATKCKAVVFATAREARNVLEQAMGPTATFSILDMTDEAGQEKSYYQGAA
ncbi:MAG: hypothetical protein ACI9U6_000019 [Loktanella salsilacus]|jgi:hypothetical protein|uniref:hypothetical protein n=1 Tax=Loktanella salsilacus TaxID=195913 RepID=UPI003988F21E